MLRHNIPLGEDKPSKEMIIITIVLESGIKYIKEDFKLADAVKIKIDHMTGKSRKG